MHFFVKYSRKIKVQLFSNRILRVFARKRKFSVEKYILFWRIQKVASEPFSTTKLNKRIQKPFPAKLSVESLR